MPADNPKSRTVNVLVDRFEKEVLPSLGPRTRKDYARHIAVLRRHFGTKVAAQLIPADFESFMNVSAGKIHRNKNLSVLSSVFSKAMREWHWLDHNVCTAVPRHKATPHHRHVADEGIEALKAVASASVRNAVDLALLTGQLQSAIVGLRWSQVTPQFVRFRNAITKKSLQVPVTPELRAVLDRCKQRSGRTPFVITTREGKRYTNEGFRAMWQRMMTKLEATGHDRFTFHDIRTRAEKNAQRGTSRHLRADNAVSRYPQFESSLRDEASEMSNYYEVFYCLERSTRKLVARVMEGAAGENWWTSGRIPQDIAAEAAGVMRKEREGGITQRSTNPIDYAFFGHLCGIITKNWDLFEAALPRATRTAIQRVIHSLNLLRGPIAHCCPMSEDEVNRLDLAVKDWLRMVS
jgi:integrase